MIMIQSKSPLSPAVFLLCLAWAALTAISAPPESEDPGKPRKQLPVPGEIFRVQGHTAFLIQPGPKQVPMPWVWYAPTLNGLPGPEEKWMFDRFTNAGIAIAGIDVGESYGSPKGRAGFTALYEELVRKRGMSSKPCLLARSRGGLMLYNWAVEHPESVSAIAGIYPVCDLRSYPGLKTACTAYDLTEEQLALHLAEHNPVDRLLPLAKAGVPILHLHGDIDLTVPLERNSGALAENYRRWDGPVTLRVIAGQGHDMWSGWFQNQELVDFVILYATGGK